MGRLQVRSPRNKADKVEEATNGNVAILDGNGNLVDSGKTLGASISAPGTNPSTKYLKGDGTWNVLTADTLPMSSSNNTTTKSAIETIDTKITSLLNLIEIVP